MTSARRVVALELASRCRACDAVVPINRLASHVTCGDCGRRTELTAETWALVLREVADGARGRDADEKASVVEAGTATFRCVVRKTAAHCLACREPVSIDEPTEQEAIACVGCGANIGVRPAPIAAPALELVVGEEPEKIAGASETRTVPCGECGALLSLDGVERTLTCRYCQASSMVPEAVWRDLHPRREVRRWFLAFSPGAAEATALTWSTLTDVANDAAGNLYCVGRLDDGDAETAVWCVTPDMTLRWAKRSLAGLPADRARLFMAQGRVAVWFPGGPVVAFLDASSGETRATYPAAGGRQPVPVTACADLLADVDGTLLALVPGERFGGMMDHSTLMRFTEDGRLVDLWPGVPPPSPPAPGDPIPLFTELQSQPRHFAGSPRLAVGHNGTLFVYGGHYNMGCWARITRNGFTTVERTSVDSETAFAADRRGCVHLLQRGALVVTDALGQLDWKLDVKDGPAGLAEERCIAVSPEGEITLAGHGGRFRRLGPRGTVLFTSEASRKADQARRDRGWA